MEKETKNKKLTAATMNWGHFAPRKRYIKDESGKVTETRYDRLLIGLRPAGREWLESHYAGDEPVTVFMLGNKNVVFAHRPGDDVVYVNSKAGAQAQEYTTFYIERLKSEKNIEARIEKVDDFPTQVIQRTGGVSSLDEAIATACNRTVEDLGI